ncbi:BLUF domain-containing protein [Sphingomonas faeni]|uniref:BLUF domain-containing protein n=1 Tax=Sphingomonas faeni TaxID=185950 RepID=UPI003364E65F
MQGLGLTGALIFTHIHFAQYIEVSRSDVDMLMESTRYDRRHADTEILNKAVTSQRMFSQ